jgi:hypothetical protein
MDIWNLRRMLILGFKTVEVRWAALFIIILLTSHLLSYIPTLRLHFV